MKLPIDYNKCSYPMRRIVREEYIKVQDNKCCYCGNDLDGEPTEEVLGKDIDLHLFPDGFFKHPVHLHHDHITGMTIGAIHNHCNAVAWQYDGV